ncbi:MAG TPA: hypothetical protein VFU47_13165 [Armatimonadota bacterium]|nr:hypothetical protein [Armatimonadota bacterium]
MQISDWSIAVLAGVVLLNTVFIAGIAVALFLLHRKLNEGLERAAPLLDRASETLARVEDTTVQVQQRVDQVLEKTTRLVDQVSERVDTTTAIAEEAVTEPLIGAASLMAGIHRGLRTYTERSSGPGAGEQGDGKNGGHS